MSWYKKALIKYKKELIQSTVISLLISFLFSLWYFASGKSFEWQSIAPISQPSIFIRYLYSAFTFVTIGAFLYYVIELWKGLHFIFVTVLGSWKLYNSVKWLVWTALILITYFYIVPTVVKILNTVISFFFNIAMFLFYLFPIIGSFVIIFIVSAYIFIYLKERPIKSSE